MSRDDRRAPDVVAVIGELALVGITLVTIASLLRVFDAGSWLWVLAGQAALAHGAMAVGRRRGLSTAITAGITLVTGAVIITALYAGEDALAGLIPTPGAVDHLARDLGDSFGQFGDIKAPVPAADGFLIGCAASVWLIAVLSDWWAFRLRATIEAVIPAGALFVVATILGADRSRALHAGLFIGAVLFHVLATRARASSSDDVWVGTDRSRGPITLLRLGGALAMLAVVFAGVVAPRLPSATAEGAVDLRNLDSSDPGPRVTVSPLVDIRSRLVEQSDVIAFQVRSEIPAYWRLTSLDRFGGEPGKENVWASNGSFGGASGDLDDGVDVDADRTVFDQQIRILALRQLWVPAAYEPQAIDADADLRYDETSGTLIVGNELNDSDGLSYRVTSALPVLDPAALATASTDIPTSIAETYLGLPDDFPTEVRQLAESITAGAESTYEKAVLLQSHFRDTFTYDLDVPAGHDDDAMMTFLFETRAGYCEQFAGTYAAMARSLGIPARVAVGFTPGERASGDDDVFNVRGLNAHAWPELYLGEFGWVLFEPTPGRGAPGAESYTGVPPQQAERTPSPDTTAVPPSTTPEELTQAPPTTRPTSELPELPESEESSPNPWPRRAAWAAVAALAVVAVYLAAVWSFDTIRARRRRRRATTDAARIATAWDDALRSVRQIGIPTPRGETQAELAVRVGARLPDAAGPLDELAGVTEVLTFAPVPPPDGSGLRAYELADEIKVHAAATQDLRTRFRRTYNPLVRLRRR